MIPLGAALRMARRIRLGLAFLLQAATLPAGGVGGWAPGPQRRPPWPLRLDKILIAIKACTHHCCFAPDLCSKVWLTATELAAQTSAVVGASSRAGSAVVRLLAHVELKH